MARSKWKVGTLIAYRIMSNESEYVRNSDIWNKYVLLRVVKVEPFFNASRKNTAVCLYDWVGETIPDPDITKNLSFTHFRISKPLLEGKASEFLIQSLENSIVPEDKRNEVISNLTKPSICTFQLLSRNCSKGIDSNAVFTVLGHDPYFEDHTPEIYEENTGGISLTHSIPLDAELVTRFCREQL